MADLIGWASSAILLVTIARQVYTQWKTQSTAGVSHWLFVGQLAASSGFTVYSLLLHNWIFVSSNVALLLTAIVGQLLYVRNSRNANRSQRTPCITNPKDGCGPLRQSADQSAPLAIDTRESKKTR